MWFVPILCLLLAALVIFIQLVQVNFANCYVGFLILLKKVKLIHSVAVLTKEQEFRELQPITLNLIILWSINVDWTKNLETLLAFKIFNLELPCNGKSLVEVGLTMIWTGIFTFNWCPNTDYSYGLRWTFILWGWFASPSIFIKFCI